MYPHQQATLDAFAEKMKQDADVIALLLVGSIAKGWMSEKSDVDVVIIKMDEAAKRDFAAHNLTYADFDIATYEGGYVDTKIIDKQFLLDVLSHGSEVAKSAFIGAKIVFSHDPEIETIITKIAEYPEHQRADKIRTFASQLYVWNWYISEAEKRDDRYLLIQAVSNLTLFGSRLLLTHNRLLYPFHKWLRRQLQEAESLPKNYFVLVDALLDKPSIETAQAYTDAILNFHDWGVGIPECFAIYIQDTEWNWRDGHAPIQDW